MVVAEENERTRRSFRFTDCQVDETCVGKRKYNKGRRQRVGGIVCFFLLDYIYTSNEQFLNIHIKGAIRKLFFLFLVKKLGASPPTALF